MGSIDSNPETGSETFDTTPGDGTPTRLTSTQDDDKGRGADDVGMSGTPVGDQKPAAHGVTGFIGEIEALKIKILELERQAKVDPAGPEREASRPQPMADLEQYRLMEACLYRHRKEWESKPRPRSWDFFDLDVRSYIQSTQSGPWNYQWIMRGERQYQRPDPFDPSHNCANDQDEADANAYDDYDHAIDYGGRRERLRKNFEWEMDRLFLAEEMDRRKRTKIKEAEEQRRRDPHAAETNKPEGDDKLKEKAPLPTFAEPKLNRLDWLLFKRLAAVEEKDACVVDILIGEPIIDDDLGGYGRWYGYSGQVHKLDRPQDRKAVASMAPGQAPLPERIRIHSAALLQILAVILRSDGWPLEELNGTTAVLIRPFKALVYCERALRDWCTALEKKFKAAEEDVPAAADGSAPGPPKDNPAQEPGRDPDQVVADDDTAEKPSTGDSVTREEAAKQGDSPDDREAEEEGEDKPDDLTKSSTALEHLKCLLSFVDSDISAKQAYLNDPQCRKVFFWDLWQLFRPGVEVIGSDGKQAYRVIDVTSAKHRVAPAWERWNPSTNKRKKTPFSITCVYIDFDGTHLGPVQKVIDFKRFDGERDVTSLEVYPLRFHPVRPSDFGDVEWKEVEALPSHERYRQKLICRGAKFLEVVAVKHMYYAGPTLEVRDEVESQVVIDFETAFSVEDEAQKGWKPDLKTMIGNPSPEDEEDIDDACRGGCCRGELVHDDSYVDQKQTAEYVDSLLPKASALNEQPSVAIIPRPLKELRTGRDHTLAVSNDELVIMSYRVFGFVLRSRKWAKLDLSHLTDIHPPAATADRDPQDNKEPATAFDRLVLEKGHRPMIVSLIAQHFRDKKSTTGQREEFDIVKGKGKGLILLLHGAPGVGKTSTAEGVAELFKKPLFQITCGDLGTTATEVEKALETNFALANRWDCILLLDEADVFLAERTKEDFKRNGLVAVFLRVMEYYAGILFLTTNRVGDFDEAFTSRIHISLYYPELNQSKTVEVFKINMDMIEERFTKRGRVINIDKVLIGSFAAQHFVDHPQARWNGRQIRNACQTALALAEFEAQGNSHEAILKPNAVVTLGVGHFEIVRNAYLEFTKYMNDLYGSNAARRAKEANLRAIWIDENDRIVATKGMGGTGVDKKTAFLLASQGQPLANHQQQPPQQGLQQPPPLRQGVQQQGFQPQGFQQPGVQQQQQQQQQQYYQYQNLAPQPGYPDSSHMQMQAQLFPTSQPWNPVVNTPFQESGEGQNQTSAPQQPPQTPPPQQQQQQQQQPNPPWFNQSIQALYAASGQQGAGQVPPSNLLPGGGGYPPGTAAPGQWPGAQGPGQQPLN